MASYSAQPSPPDRAKAAAAVALIHAGLAAVILSGLNVDTVERAVEHLKAFDITEPEPPPPPPPPPAVRSERARDDPGAPAKKAEPTPVVAPPPKVVVPAKPPIVAAPIAGTGSAPSAGAAAAGTGTGAGGSGSGRGGGGSGDFSGFTPARLVRNIGNRDYRLLAGGRVLNGTATVSLRIEPSGLPTQCRIVRSSGDSAIDAGLCPLITQRLRFQPALDVRGRPIPYYWQYVANWSL
ncbi:TonB family protein [Sphingomonas sp.]|uniref:TonB family protein n=1 Tax=Sphingomonas sp. TaxID=28214 RepID=UPI00286DDA80|nr:TonB family protein [Sphingomonas sp.]